MMISKYLFIHLTILICFVFLAIPFSYSHPQDKLEPSPLTENHMCQCPCPCTPPANNNNNPSPQLTPPDKNMPPNPPGDSNQPPPQPPKDSDMPSQPPSDSDKRDQPPSESDKPPQAPSDSDKPPQPPSDGDKPSQPPGGESDKPPQPPSDGDKPSQPPGGESDKPPQPPNDGGETPESPNDDDKTLESPDDDDETPKPPNDGDETPESPKPPNDSDQTPQPPIDQTPQPPIDQTPQPPNNGGDETTQAPNDEDQTPSPPNDGDQTPQPPNDDEETPQPPNDSGQTPQPPNEGAQTPQPPNDGQQTAQPPHDSDKPSPSPPVPENNQSPPIPPNNNNNQPPGTQSNIDFEGSFSKIYAFGDSYTDTGNSYVMGGLQSFVGSFISQLPGFNQLQGHRQCDGRLVVDFLCEKLAVPYLPPYKQASANFSWGANFAVGGATSFSHDNFAKLLGNQLMWKGSSDFQAQVEWFLKFKGEVACKGMSDGDCKIQMENSLFWIGEIGGSDYARSSGTSISHKLLTDQTLAHVSKIVTSLLESGAKYIVVQGLPPLGCCPLELYVSKVFDRDQMGCSSIFNTLIQAHNDQLQKMISEWQKQYSGCIIVYADYWGAYRAILQDYKKYNFEEPFKACCGAGGPLNFNMHSLCGSFGTSTCKDPSRYMSWDGIHLTEAMNKQITNLFLNDNFCKPSFSELVKMKKGM